MNYVYTLVVRDVRQLETLDSSESEDALVIKLQFNQFLNVKDALWLLSKPYTNPLRLIWMPTLSASFVVSGSFSVNFVESTDLDFRLIRNRELLLSLGFMPCYLS